VAKEVTRVFFCSSYVAPEYASRGILNKRSDTYNFGILIMEIISGRNPKVGLRYILNITYVQI
jgi:hypothetical protein